MQVGNLVNGLEVVHVVRVTSLNLMAFTRDVNKYIQDGYHIDVASTREVGLQKRVDMYKLESAVSEKKSEVNPVENLLESVKEDVVKTQETEVSVEVGEQKILVNPNEEIVPSDELEVNVDGDKLEEEKVPTKKTTSTRKKTS